MSRDIGRIELPTPPLEYDAAYMRSLVSRTEDLIRSRASLNELAPYGGTPHAALQGTAPAFSTPGSGVITKLPYNTVVQANPNLLDATVPVFKLKYTMNLQSFVMLHHVSGGGGNSTITTYAYLNNVIVSQNTQTIALNSNDVYTRTLFFKDVPYNQSIEFAISHTGNPAIIIDMTKSRWWLNQLTPDPRYISSETRPGL